MKIAEVYTYANVGFTDTDVQINFMTLNVTRIWPMPNVMATLPNVGGTLSSMPQSLAGAHY